MPLNIFVCAEREVGSGVCMHSCVCACTHIVCGGGGVCVCAHACVCVCVCSAHECPCMPSVWVVHSQHCSLEVSIYIYKYP